jgi:hypothetical protein
MDISSPAMNRWAIFIRRCADFVAVLSFVILTFDSTVHFAERTAVVFSSRASQQNHNALYSPKGA